MENKNTAVSVLCRIMMTHRACVCFGFTCAFKDLSGSPAAEVHPCG